MTKESQENGIEELVGELTKAVDSMEKTKKDMDDKYRELHAAFDGRKTDHGELEKSVKEHAKEYAALATQFQALGGQVDELKKQMDAPIHRSEKDLEDSDRKAAIELQKRIFLSKNVGVTDDDFQENLDELVPAKTYRALCRKLTEVGIKSKAEIVRGLSADERKAFDMASLDIAFFSPEMLGLEIDCNIECWSLTDLYGQESVSRSTFMYPKIESYGAIGSYDCDAKCDAELGPEGNIRYLNGKTYDFRGVFCFQKKVLQEANYDLLGFMMRAAQRSYRINRNQALITGDGINQPLGWLTADCFRKIATPQRAHGTDAAQPSFNHVDYRRFIAAHPVEYGSVVATMHQNIFAYLASAVDSTGRFIFGDGDMTFSPDAVRDRIRISNCLPDATEGGTLGDVANPFVVGSFLLAAANWEMAYKAVSKRSMFMEQYEGGTTAWCVKYQFGAEDGGFVGCCPAGQTLVVGGPN